MPVVRSAIDTRAWVAIIASALAMACSANGTGGFGGGGEDGGSSASSSGSGSSGGQLGSSGSGGGSGGGAGGSDGGGGNSSGAGGSSGGHADGGGAGINTNAVIPATDFDTSVTLTAQTFTVKAGDEVYMCQVFPNPFGKDTDILELDGTMSAGSHHFFLFNMDPNLTALAVVYAANIGKMAACPGAGKEFHPFPYLSQQPVWNVRFPTGADGSPMAYPLVAANSLMINVHYLNATSSAINASVKITLKPAKAGFVKTHVGTIFLNNTTLTVPPTPMSSPVDEPATWAGDSALPATYTIYSSWSHMHKWGLKFTASTNGSVFYTETNWDSPSLCYGGTVSGPGQTCSMPQKLLNMTNNQSITWTTTYYNDTGATLTFGDSAVSNVMSIYMGQYFPASATAPDIIDVLN